MDTEAVVDIVKPVVYPAIGAVLTVAARGIIEVVRMLRRRREKPEADAEQAAETVLLPDWVQWRLDTVRPEEPERRRGLLWGPVERLPALPRRASVWKATVVGSFLVGFGIAGYFRTRADVLVGIALTTPVFVAAAFVPSDKTASDSSDATGPSWAYGVIYTTMAVTGVYSYLRATSSNRRLEATVPSGRVRPMRRDILERELQILAADRWQVESQGEFEAIVVRTKRPNHWLHLALTLMTVYLWSFVWIAKTRASRRKRELEYRRVSVDERGSWSVEPWLPDAGREAPETTAARPESST